jgi:hypothetical protein
VAEQKQAALVGPLEIVEDEDDGLFLDIVPSKTDNGGKEQEPLGVGVGGLRRWQFANATGQRGNQPGQLRPVGLDVGQELFLGSVGDVMP